MLYRAVCDEPADFFIGKGTWCALFVREKRVLRLTAEGETLVLEARKILNQVNNSRLLVQSIAKGYQHVFRIGCNGDLCRENLPRA